MKERVGEVDGIVGRVALLTVVQIACPDRREHGIIEEWARQRVEQRREPTDGGAPPSTSWAQNALNFPQTGEPVFPFDEMVERTEKQNCIGGGIAVGQGARVANFRRRERRFGLPNR